MSAVRVRLVRDGRVGAVRGRLPTRRPRRPTSAPPVSEGLRRLLGQIVLGGSNVEITRDVATRPGEAVVAAWAVLPSAAHPRMIVPLGNRQAAARSLRLRWDSYWAPRVHVKRALVLAGLRTGVLPAVLGERVEVVRLPVNGSSLVESLLPARLAEVFGTPIIVGAENIDDDPHKNQVLHAMTAVGEPVGFVKVSRGELSRALLGTEAAALKRLGNSPLPGMQVPRVLDHGAWQDGEVLVTARLQPDRRSVVSRTDPPALALTAAVFEAGHRERSPLAVSNYWAGVRVRVDGHVRSDTRNLGARLARLTGELERLAAQEPLELGGWHGDWLPWNMAHCGSELLVWDWEYAGLSAPLGFDLLHFLFGVAFFARDADAITAAARAEARGLPLLRQLGVGDPAARVTFTAYLLEMLLRRLDIVVSGGGADDDRVYPMLPDALEQALGRLADRVPSRDGRP